jgi:hypothetical protein
MNDESNQIEGNYLGLMWCIKCSLLARASVNSFNFLKVSGYD